MILIIAIIYFIGVDNHYKFSWWLVLSGFSFAVGIMALHYMMNNSDIVTTSMITRGAGIIGSIALSALLLKDFPKSPGSYVGIGIVAIGIIVMTFFSSK